MAKKRAKRKENKPRKVWVMRINSVGIPFVQSGDVLGRHSGRVFVRDERGASIAAFPLEVFSSETAACEAAIASLQKQIDAITAQQDYYRHRIAAASATESK